MSDGNNFFSSTLGVVFGLSYILSFPLALIFGDKWDVVLALFIPFYGVFVAIGS